MKVSVIILTIRGREKMLQEAFRSICKQTVKPYEVIVVFSEENLTRKWAIENEAIAKSDGDAFIPFCDDDILDPTYIEKTTRRMKETKADIIGTYLENFGNETGIHGFSEIPPGTSLIRKSIWEKVGGYDETMTLGGDVDFFKMCREKRAKIEILQEPLLKYRRHLHNWGNTKELKGSYKTMKEKDDKRKMSSIAEKGFSNGYRCLVCGKKIHNSAGSIDQDHQLFCSPECMSKYDNSLKCIPNQK